MNVRNIPKEELMNTVTFVFQNSRLIKASVLDNVRMGKPDATREEVMAALKNAQCQDIIEKLPEGVDTVIGAKGVYLSGGERQRIAIEMCIRDRCRKAIDEIKEENMTPELLALKGRCQVIDGHFADALKTFDEALRADPSVRGVRLMKGMLLQSKKDYKGALAMYDEALKRGEDPEAVSGIKAALLYEHCLLYTSFWKICVRCFSICIRRGTERISISITE